MVDLSYLKKRNSLSQWKNKLENIDKEKSGSRSSDDRFWLPKKNEKGKAEAVIRFLPVSKEDAAIDPEMFPWVKVLYHNFRGDSGKYYNESCLSTIGRTDPVKEAINPLWQGTDDEKKIARERKSKTSFISNILVLKDPSCPENNGKVFLYKYGIKIHEKICAAMFPEEDLAGRQPVNVTDFWKGANFHVKVRTVDGYPNYDESKFLESGPLFRDDDDSLVEGIWSKEYSLLQFVDPSNFKTYDELKARYEEVIAVSTAKPKTAAEIAQTKTVRAKPTPEKIVAQAKAVVEEDEDNDVGLLANIKDDDDFSDLDAKIDSLFAED